MTPIKVSIDRAKEILPCAAAHVDNDKTLHTFDPHTHILSPARYEGAGFTCAEVAALAQFRIDGEQAIMAYEHELKALDAEVAEIKTLLEAARTQIGDLLNAPVDHARGAIRGDK